MTFEQVQAQLEEIKNNPQLFLRKVVEEVNPTYEVVWSGRDPLIPERESVEDSRLKYVPSFDLDEGEAAQPTRETRKYNKTGNHRGTLAAKVLKFPAGESI